MKLIRGDKIVDVSDENVISAFKEAGYTEAPEAEKAEEAPKKRKSTNK